MSRRLLFVAGFVLTAHLSAADPAPTDIAEYKPAAQAATTQIAKVRFEPARQGHIGIGIEPNDDRLKIDRIERNSAAETAGLHIGDVVKSLNGTAVTSIEKLKGLLVGKRSGESVDVIVDRDGKPLTIAVKLQAVSHPLRDPTAARPVIGVKLQELDKGLGVEITEVTPGSPAEAAGIKVGDVVTKVDGTATVTLDGVRRKFGDRVPGDSVKVSVRRHDQMMELSVALALQTSGEQMPTTTRWDDRVFNRVFRKPVYRLAVIPIAYPDVKPNEKITTAAWQNALFSSGAYKEKSPTGQTVYGSMNDYYAEISCGKFKVDGKVFPAVTVGKNRNDYMQTPNRFALLTDACDQLIARDGEKALDDFDGIFFIYSGNRVLTQRGGIYWPHRLVFPYKGKRWDYFITSETAGGNRQLTNGSPMTSISVVCHEFGHMLGLPDLYFREEDPNTNGLGVWCTMSIGHGQDGKPLHFSARCKEQMGWIKPAVLDPRVKQKLILAPINGSDNECYKVLLRADGSEYLLLENRIKKGFDRDLPGEGLLIWRVAEGRVSLEESHGIGGPAGPTRYMESVPYPSSSNRSFTPDTVPSSKSTKPGAWPVHITDIRRLSDGRITFQIGYEYL